MATTGASKPTLTLHFRDMDSLYTAYMPFLTEGGLFIATERHFEIGDEITAMLHLPGDSEPLKVGGRVVWLNPRATAGRPAGIGIHFGGEQSRAASRKIETLLAPLLKSGRSTYTL